MNKVVRLIFVGAFLLAGVSCSSEHGSARSERPIYRVDLWKLYEQEGFDSLNKKVNATYFITALQGIVNRDEPVLFLDASLNLIGVELDGTHIPNRNMQVDSESMDQRWLDWMRESGMLNDRPVVQISSLKELVDAFAGQIAGLVLWDMETPSSVNLALTAAGCENLLPLSIDLDAGFLRQHLQEAGAALPTVRDFTGFFERATQDGLTGKELVYQAMLDLYLKSGKASPAHFWFNVDAFAWKPPVISYGGNQHLGARNTIQQNGLYNCDYWVSQRGLFVDLYPMGDEAPNDDLEQVAGTDLRLWNDLLEESYHQRNGAFGVMGGFAPWWVKYTDQVGNSHPPIDAEQSFVRLATSYNLWNDADAAFGLSNASFYRHLPLPDPAEFSNPQPSKLKLRKDTIYVSLFMLDYDGSAWLNQMAHTIYDRPGRGEVPLNWAINPILADRVPHVFRYLLSKRTDQDFFCMGDDGAGYIDPYYLIGDHRTGRIKTDGFEAYRQAANPYLDKLNMDLMAFYISDQEFTSDMFSPIAELTPAGMGGNRSFLMDDVDGVPVHYLKAYHHRENDGFEKELARLFERAEPGVSRPGFYAYRLILFRPDMISKPIARLRAEHPDARIEFVDAHTFMALKKEASQLPLESPWMNNTQVTCRPRKTGQGLEPVFVADGLFTANQKSSPAVWELASVDDRGRYFYFGVDDAFSKVNELVDGLLVKISVRCDQPVTIGLEYNSMWPDGNFPNPYVTHPLKKRLSGGSAFQEVVFELHRPYFKNSQNSMADFRFTFSKAGAVQVKCVSVEKQ